MLAAAVLVGVVVLISMNSGPITSTQAIRAARTTPSTLEPRSAPFCRVVAALPVVDSDAAYVGSAEHLAGLAALEAAATPTVRLHLGALRQYLDDGDPAADVRDWPDGVQDAVAAIEDYAIENC
jgi:hypothetical protein